VPISTSPGQIQSAVDSITTPSGGTHLVFVQPPEAVTRFQWSANVEVLGTSSLLTCYDLDELLFPRVAPRAVLPKMFWKAKGEDGSKGVPKIKSKAPPLAVEVEVASLTAALWRLDPVDWRGDYDGWFALATACQFVGIAKAEWVKWSLSDPVYAADARLIERIWDSAKPKHGGAFYAACAERGVRVSKAAGREASSPLYLGHPLSASSTSASRSRQPTRNWLSRVNTVCAALSRKQDADCLFWAGCRVAEVMIDTKKPTLKVARALLEAACPNLRKAIGADEISRIITNAFHEVEKGELEG
jgi:hypothetical protein